MPCLRVGVAFSRGLGLQWPPEVQMALVASLLLPLYTL